MELCGCNGCLLRQSSRQTDWLNPQKITRGCLRRIRTRGNDREGFKSWRFGCSDTLKIQNTLWLFITTQTIIIWQQRLKCESRFDRSWVPDTTQPRGPWTHHAARKPKNLSSASPERIVRLFGFNESYMSLRLFVSTLRDTLIVEASYWSKF